MHLQISPGATSAEQQQHWNLWSESQPSSHQNSANSPGVCVRQQLYAMVTMVAIAITCSHKAKPPLESRPKVPSWFLRHRCDHAPTGCSHKHWLSPVKVWSCDQKEAEGRCTPQANGSSASRFLLELQWKIASTSHRHWWVNDCKNASKITAVIVFLYVNLMRQCS